MFHFIKRNKLEPNHSQKLPSLIYNNNQIPQSQSYPKNRNNNPHENFRYGKPISQYDNSNSDINSNKSNCQLNISYDNYFLDENLQNIKKSYGDELRQQIKENERRREMERKKRKEEERIEDLKIKKYLEEEEKKTKKIIKSNSNHSISHFTYTSTPNKKKVSFFIDKEKKPLTKFEKYLNQRKVELNEFNNEMIRILSQIRNDHNRDMKGIEFDIEEVRNQNFHANMYKVDLGKGIKEIKDTIKYKELQEDFKEDYLYKVNEGNKCKKKEKEAYAKLDNIKLPIINLSQHIIYPGKRSDNDWFFDEHKFIEEEHNKRERDFPIKDLYLKNSQRIEQLNKYKEDYIYKY